MLERWITPSLTVGLLPRFVTAERGFIDEIIEPAQTRPKLIRALALLENKRDQNPPKKHGNIPL
jgi:propionyl-CoA carboxylase beta chain